MIEATTAPKWVALELLHHGSPAARFDPTNLTLAQAAIEEIKALSGLTNELIAPLVGVSRRSLQAWIAGESISQPREQRLLELRATLRTLDAGNADATYRRLMDRAPGRVRVYDLLASGRFDTAVDIATGRRSAVPSRTHRVEKESLAVQLSRLEDRVEVAEPLSTGQFAGRLRR